MKNVREIFKYIGLGFFVIVGFIDFGNWVLNVVVGSSFGLNFLWVVFLLIIILIVF